MLAATAVAGTAAADIKIHQEHSFEARPGATLIVDVSFHSVEVAAREGTTIDIAVDVEVEGSGSSAKNAANDLQPKFIDEGDRLIVRSTRSKGWSWKSVSAKGRVVVSMPPGINLTIDSSSGGAHITGDLGNAVVRFDASSGDVTVDGAMRELHCDTSSGSIRAKVTRPLESFTADASSGSVRLEGGAQRAQAATSSGSITVADLAGDGSFSSSSGSIAAQWASLPAGSHAKAGASSGSVTLRFPPGSTLSGTVDVGSGSIRTDFPGTLDRKHLSLSGVHGAAEVRVSTSSGSVKLLKN
jgi:DUF4097 and DUF4098 domain-containing protein YvlB